MMCTTLMKSCLQHHMKKKKIFRWASAKNFSKNPVIAKWMDDCIARDVSLGTRQQYIRNVWYMFCIVNRDPKIVISSKKAAIKFWTKFMVEYKRVKPQNGTHGYRVSYKNFLASYDIIFPTRMATMYGLSSAHDDLGKHAGVSFTPEMTEEIGNMILNDGDFRTYVYYRIVLRTAARNKAVSRMTWERIYLDEKNEDGSESFRLEQHETKDPRGDIFLGENGEWKEKFPPPEIKKLLLEWKLQSGNSRFLWFEDDKSDAQNRRNAERVAEKMAARLKYYYKKIADRVDPRTREYMLIRPVHILRHTCAQQLKNADFTSEDIAQMGGWRYSQTVELWYTKMSEKKRRQLGMRGSKVKF